MAGKSQANADLSKAEDALLRAVAQLNGYGTKSALAKKYALRGLQHDVKVLARTSRSTLEERTAEFLRTVHGVSVPRNEWAKLLIVAVPK